MKIQSSNPPSIKTLSNPKTSRPAAAPEPSESFFQSYGPELGVGAFMGAMGSVPVLGAMSNWGMGTSLLQYKEFGAGLTGFELTGGLAARAAGIANLAGTCALVQGNGALALGLLAGAGVVTGTIAALAMDGGSLASRLGLQK
ncbi:hypothetical protein ABS71_03630 [bacterium SCN 62-11]|nr:MAG: hypothetical protein ABS71_03630 [bacterium SCN 62-11]